MKIFNNNVIYVQKNDLAYLTSFDVDIPASIFLKVFGEGAVIIDDHNRYDFVEFDSESEIEFFKSQDWIINYNELKDLKPEEIMAYSNDVAFDHDKYVVKYNSMSKEDKKQNSSLATKCDILKYKCYSLRDLYLFKIGKLDFPLPEGIEKPKQKSIFAKLFNKKTSIN